jgi:hypothetical protein
MPGTVGTDALLNALTCHVVLMMPEWGGSVDYATRERTLPPSHVQKHKPGAARVNRDDRLCCRTCIHLMRSQHIRLSRVQRLRHAPVQGANQDFAPLPIDFFASYLAASKSLDGGGLRDCNQVLPVSAAPSHFNTACVPSRFGLPPVADMLNRNTHVSGLARGLLAASNMTDDAHFTGPACSCPR